MDTKTFRISDLENLIESIILKVQNKKGLNAFAINRSKFEGWLKVEVIDSLIEQGYEAKPEIDRIDVSIKNEVAIELKTANTNYRFLLAKVENKTRPITNNIEGIIADIEKLKLKFFDRKYVIFVIFPVSLNNHNLSYHVQKIEEKCKIIIRREFEFNDCEIKAIIYVGEVE